MGWFQDYKPELAMMALQTCYAGNALFGRAAVAQGMSPRIFVVYRQAIATLVIVPVAYFSRRNSTKSSLGLRSFSLIFLASFIGVTVNQNLYYEGIYLSSSTMASAMGNLVPAITFIMASIVGLEKLKFGSLRSIAKIGGTILCVGGAISMSFLKGSKLLNVGVMLPVTNSIFWSPEVHDYWLIGCLLLFTSTFCWAFWLILQVKVSNSYEDHLSLSAWMCICATFQAIIFALCIEHDPNDWIIHSPVQLGSCLFAGVIGSAFSFFVQSWAISIRGPLFSAMFSPLATVIVTVLAALFLNEEIYIGSLIGAIGVIAGLYIVLWGKAGDIVRVGDQKIEKFQSEDLNVKIAIDESLEEPLLQEKAISTKLEN